tara:strand:+ start:3062 stop:3397 length:336 start_codon:yes stop_codon:yes gene_type:complete
MYTSSLPDIGDIITFAAIWQLHVVKEVDGNMPHGVVTSKKKYGELQVETKKNSLVLYGTLAYPLSMGGGYINDQIVYIVHWASSNTDIINSYRYINEEWFHNNSFVIVSKA